jgi:hypothetical protein
MTVTSATSLTNIINSEVIELRVADYLIDANVFAPLASYRSIAGLASKVWTFTRWVKDAGADVTDGTGISDYTEMTMAQSTITVGVYGIAREITDFAAATTVLGEQQLMQRVFEDGVALCKEMLEDDLAALPASFTGSTAGTSGVDNSMFVILEAVAKARTAKLRGSLVGVLDDQQANDLMQSAASVTGVNWQGNNAVLNSRTDGFVGNVAGVNLWYSNLTDTANTAADVAGGIWLDPQSNDDQCAIGMVELWMPRIKDRVDPLMVSREISVTYAAGAGAKYPAAGIPVITDA